MIHDLYLGVSEDRPKQQGQTRLPFVGTAMLSTRLLARLPSLMLRSDVMESGIKVVVVGAKVCAPKWRRDGKKPARGVGGKRASRNLGSNACE